MRKYLIIFAMLLVVTGCEMSTTTSEAEVKQVDADIKTDAQGVTVEQKNVKLRLEDDNIIGAIKHLYVISAYSGQVLIYSTVQGKVTSSGKRLQPYETSGPSGDSFTGGEVMTYTILGKRVCSKEIIQADGTFGSSVEYLYWWDTKGVYHQHYVSGGQILHISDQPLAVKSITINMNLSGEAQ